MLVIHFAPGHMLLWTVIKPWTWVKVQNPKLQISTISSLNGQYIN